MAKLVQARYAPLYVSLAAGFLIVLLLLGPGPAVGLSVDVDSSENGDTGQTSFAKGEDVALDVEVDLEGREEAFTSATFTVRQVEGGSGFTGIVIDLPGEQGTYVTVRPPEDVDVSSIGSARLDVVHEGVSPASSGSTMSYTGGKILYSIIYLPPRIGGDYTATVQFETAQDARTSTFSFTVEGFDADDGDISPLWWIIPIIVGGVLLVTGGAILVYVKGRRGL